MNGKRELDATVIRRASAADVAELAALRLALFQDLGRAAAGEERAFVAACSSAYAASFASASAVAWIAEAGGVAVATLTLLVFPRLPAPGSPGTSEGYVVGVYTRPAWRRRGLAAALLSAAVVHARERGLARLRLHTTEAGRRVYAEQGFRRRDDELELVL